MTHEIPQNSIQLHPPRAHNSNSTEPVYQYRTYLSAKGQCLNSGSALIDSIDQARQGRHFRQRPRIDRR